MNATFPGDCSTTSGSRVVVGVALKGEFVGKGALGLLGPRRRDDRARVAKIATETTRRSHEP